MWSQVDPRNYVVDGGPYLATGMGTFEGAWLPDFLAHCWAPFSVALTSRFPHMHSDWSAADAVRCDIKFWRWKILLWYGLLSKLFDCLLLFSLFLLFLCSGSVPVRTLCWVASVANTTSSWTLSEFRFTESHESLIAASESALMTHWGLIWMMMKPTSHQPSLLFPWKFCMYFGVLWFFFYIVYH